MFTPLSWDDHAWVRNIFPQKSGAAVYSDSWLYLTQACRGALGPLGAYYRRGSFFVGLGQHDDHWVLVRPIGPPPDDFLENIAEFVATKGGSPVLFIKKADAASLAMLEIQAKEIDAVLHSGDEFPWDVTAAGDDDTFPEYVVETRLAAHLPHGTGRSAQRLRSKLRQCVDMKPLRTNLAAPGAKAALQRFLRSHFDDDLKSVESYDNMINILSSEEHDWLSHYISTDHAREVVGFFAYERLDASSVGIYASVVSRKITGLSERLMLEFIEDVSHTYSFANLGGSETVSLDRYKQKYATDSGRRNPLFAIDLSPTRSFRRVG